MSDPVSYEVLLGLMAEDHKALHKWLVHISAKIDRIFEELEIEDEEEQIPLPDTDESWRYVF